MQTLYETERLCLKQQELGHAPLLLDYYLRNRIFLEDWDAKREDSFFTLTHQEEILQKELDDIATGRAVRFLIFKKGNEDKIIGVIGLANIIRGPFLSCFLGYKLDADEINQGYMTEAARKLIDIAFSELGLHRIEANIMPQNFRSLRVAEKLGFQNEGLAKKYLNINGVWQDHLHMVLFNDYI